MQTIKYVPDDWLFILGPNRAPVAHVQPGETFVVETADAFCNRLSSPEQDMAKDLLPYGNPVTGPIYVDGAKKGDTLTVSIHSIQTMRDYAVSVLMPNAGGLVASTYTRMLNDPLPPKIMLHPINGDQITFGQGLDIPPIPFEPFYGTIGTSPELEGIYAAWPGGHGGNMDVPDMAPGNTIHFPVNTDGALLYLGDVHAAQGDGEVCGSGMEIPARGVMTVDLIRGQAITTPRIDSKDYIMVVGNAKPLEDATRLAFVELILWLESQYGMERLKAYPLVSHVAKFRLGNIVDPLYSVVAKFPKRYLPR